MAADADARLFTAQRIPAHGSVTILHILDHSLPAQTGYSYRTRAIIIRQQHELGWETSQLNSSKHPQPGPEPETVHGLTFYRSKVHSPWLARLPAIGQFDVILSLARRIRVLVPKLKPDILHAYSPVLNGLAAISVARRQRLPVSTNAVHFGKITTL